MNRATASPATSIKAKDGNGSRGNILDVSFKDHWPEDVDYRQLQLQAFQSQNQTMLQQAQALSQMHSSRTSLPHDTPHWRLCPHHHHQPQQEQHQQQLQGPSQDDFPAIMDLGSDGRDCCFGVFECDSAGNIVESSAPSYDGHNDSHLPGNAHANRGAVASQDS